MNVVAQLNTSLAGRYVVEREIGAGGMATVYLARDLKHDRHVALKLLNPELGAVLGVERFLSEIKVTANLQHPNLLPLFDSGEADGLLFYVMPFVEGESLRARLTREKQLPVDEAIRIAVAVAGALDYAHGHGVIHRDLKPENILLQHGQPVVADFGIALAVSNAGGARITQTGLSLGTPHYMSPEQATGDRTVDGRTDIYSLACVLYEMLTGDPPHTASTAQAIIAKVLTDRPRSVRASRPSVPEYMDAAIDRALEKLPADRWGSAREFAEALQGRGPTSTTSTASRPATIARPRLRDPVLVATAIVALIAVGASALLWKRASGGEAVTPVRFTLATSADIRVVDAPTWAVTLSPDGRLAVFTGVAKGGKAQLYVRPIDQLVARPIAGTENATQPVFSPDGKWLAFEADNKLKKVQLEGGAPISLADASGDNGLDWALGDVIVIGAEGREHGLSRVPAAGGTPVAFTHRDSAKKELDHLWPLVLPDGKTVLFAVWYGGTQASRIAIASLDGGPVTVLDVPGIAPLGVFAGHLVFVRWDGVVLAIPFDVKHRKVTGGAVPVVDVVSVCAACNGDAKVRISKSGSLVYLTGATGAHLVWVTPQGKETPVLDEMRSFGYPRISPDGQHIAVSLLGTRTTDIWTYDVATKTLSKLTSGGNARIGEWTADSKRVVFASDSAGVPAIYMQAADRSGTAERLLAVQGLVFEASLSPDGRTIMYATYANNNADLMTVSASGGTPQPFAATDANEGGGQFSPDGRRIAYASNESGQNEVYVRSFPDAGGRIQVSVNGGSEPVWARDGRRLYYRNGSHMMAADVTAAGTVAGRVALFDGNYYQDPIFRAYDVGGPGPRFVMLKAGDSDLQAVVVTNWIEELKHKVAKP